MDPRLITPDGNNERILCGNQHDTAKNAKRYCFQCQKFLCNDCLVERDLDHLRDNTIISVDEYFENFKGEIVSKLKTIEEAKRNIVPFQNSVKDLIDNKIDIMNKKVENFTSELTKELFNLNDSTRTQMSKLREEFFTKLKKTSPVFKYINQDFEVICQELEKCSKEWDVNLRNDRIKIISEVNSLYSEPEMEIRKVINNFGNLKEELNSIFLEFQSKLDKKLDDFKFEEKNKKIKEILYNSKSLQPELPVIGPGQREPRFNVINKLEMNVIRDPSNATIRDFIDKTNSIKQEVDNTFIIGTKASNTSSCNIIYIYWNNKIHDIPVNTRHLQKLNIKGPFPMKNSRIANIGSYAIITGGTLEQNSESIECFKITPYVENNNLQIRIDEFPSMNDARERHNMIYLPNLNSLIVCSSFQRALSTEICQLDQTWIKLKDMNTKRANSTLVYVDDRWLFCISGYILNIQTSNGIYSDSYEVLDMNNTNLGWKQYGFPTEFQNLKLSAMGCINLNKGDFILVGGFNGSRYMSSTYHVTTKNGQLESLKEIENTLDTGVIFQNALFTRTGRSYFNFDYTKVCELIGLK
jgi:hypothetical protein